MTIQDRPLGSDRARLLQQLLRKKGIEVSRAPAITRRAGPGPWRLSFSQERLWFIDQLEPGTSAYNIPYATRLVGPLDVAALRETFQELVHRHEALRTTFQTSQGQPAQVVAPAASLALPLIDLAGLPAALREPELRRLVSEDAERPFELDRGPLLRLTLVRSKETEHAVLLTMHHIIGDGWSMGILMREATMLYEASRQHRPPSLPELPVQYADFAEWQRQWLADDVLETEVAYWRDKLQGLPPVVELPTDRPRPLVQTFRGATRTVRLSGALRDGLMVLSHQQRATLFMTLLAAFEALLGRHSGQDDLAVGTPIAGRKRSELENVIGFFVNTLVLRGDLTGDPTFRDLLDRVRASMLEAQAHQDLPLGKLVEELRPERSLSHNALFQVMFSLEAAAVREEQSGFSELVLRPLSASTSTAKVDLTLVLTEGEEAVTGWLEYNTDLFNATTVDRLTGHLGTLLAAIVRDPDRRLSELPLLTTPEIWQILVEWNDTPSGFPRDRCVHELFALQALRTPDAMAVAFDGVELTYRELDRRANALAWELHACGVRPDDRIGVALERSAELVAALLAVLKAGGSYVPLDPDYPTERLAFMVEDARIAVLLARERSLASLPDHRARVVLMDGAWDAGAECEDSPVSGAAPDHLAYVMYTSGSTGRPKGVAVPHRGIVRLVVDNNFAPLGTGDRVAQASNAAFDAATFEIWGALLNGGQLVGIRREVALSPRDLAARLVEDRIDVLFLTTALFNQIAIEAPEAFGRLRHLLFGGEAVDPNLVRRVLGRGAPRRLLHVYGPTESTTYTSCFPVEEVARRASTVPIGRPISATGIHLLDAGLWPVPAGVSGELCIGGDGLARGYLDRPELTAERFIPNPFGVTPGERLYRTGDICRFLPTGDVEFQGRRDHQVKIRGFRIELGEIETALGSHPGLRDALVLAREDTPGDKRLVAYLVPEEGREIAAAELRDLLRRKLPDYMVPAAFVFLEAFPLNPNGKVDRRALPAPDAGARSDLGLPYLPPRTPTEQIVAAVFGDVLGAEMVGLHDDFFVLGGHSLLATRAVSRLREALGIEVPLRDLFEEPTVGGLAARLDDELRRGAGIAAPPIRPVPREGDLPVSFAQQRLWFIDQLDPGSRAYNMPVAMRLEGPLRSSALEIALLAVVRRHEALRTTLAERDGEPLQRIGEPVLALPVVDLRGLAAGLCDATAARLAGEDAREPFDLAKGPLLRGTLLALGEEEHALLVTMHHIVSDGWSIGVMIREVSELYRALLEERPAALPELPIQYADYAAWQRSWLQGEALEHQLGYWRRQLAGAPALLELPTDRPRPAVQTNAGALVQLDLPRELTGSLRLLSQERGATLFMTLLAGFQTLLARSSGQWDVSVGMPIAGRNRREVEGLIGLFVNTLVLRVRLDGEAATFGGLMERVRDTALEAHAHQDLPFEKLVEELRPERSLGHTPLFQVMFDLMHAAPPLEAPEGLRMSPLAAELGVAKFDLSLALEEAAGTLVGSLEYNTDLFDPATAVRLVERWKHLLQEAVRDPRQRLEALPLLSEAEREQVVVAWNDTGDNPAGGFCLHELFEERARQAPGAPALLSAGGQVSYGELDAAANQLARELRNRGVGPDVPVAVCCERGPDLIVALLAVLKAGGAYLPLDPAYPVERLAHMLEDAGAPVLVTQEPLRPRLPAGSWQVVDLERDRERIARRRAERPQPLAVPGSLAYVMYTSGTSGRPKGVMIEHRSAAWYGAVASAHYGIRPADRVLQFSSISFDISVEEIFSCLSGGAALVLLPGLDALDPRGLLAGCADAGVTVACLPTAYWHELAREAASRPEAIPPSLRLVCMGGEKVLPDRVARWQGQLGERVALLNSYGPTETTVVASLFPVPAAWEPGRDLPLGRPIRGARTYVVDPWLVALPAGIPGELCIGGAGVARGYLGRPDLTAERFVPDPFGETGGRLYRTGDRARWGMEGELEFLGRVDLQVKVRGFRIEPGEIEAALQDLPGVREALVAARQDAPGERRLVAYLVPDGDAGLAIPALREALRRRLPDYMVPAAFVVLEALPLTPNGKVDRKALPAPETPAEEASAYLAPRTPAEEIVAGVFADVLSLERVGGAGHFFELGGHSLLATRAISRLRGAFRVELPLRALFEAPTVEALAARVEHEMRAGSDLVAPPIVPVPRDRELPLSFAQQRLWFIDQLEPGSPLYNIPLAFRVEGPLDAGLLARSLQEVVHRHEALRTVFAAVDGVPVQVILPAEPFALPLLDLRALDAGRREAVAQALIAQESGRPFDLAHGPLFRAVLLRLGERDHAVVVAMHHIVSDGWSVGVLMREVTDLYRAFAEGRPSPLPELPVQYADFAAWQRGWLAGEVLERQLSYWKGKLAGAPPALDLPTDRPRPAVQTFRGATRELRLSRELTAGVEALGRKNGATPFMVLLAAFQAVLSRWSGQSDVSVGSPIAGRNRLEIEGLIGFFVNTLVLRTELADAPAFTDLLERVRESSLEAHTHQDVPFEKLVEELEPERSLSHSPLFQVLFILQNTPQGETAEVSDLVLRPWGSGSGLAKFDLTLAFEETDGRLTGGFEHNTDLFDASTAERLAGHLERLLEAGVATPAVRVDELPLLGEAERVQVLVEWNDTRTAHPLQGLLHEMFAAQVRRTPDRGAVSCDGRTLTYADLDQRSGRLARALQELGVGPDVRVGLCLERSIELVVGLLGVLKAGGSYVPIDPEYPRDRIVWMLEDCRAPVVLTQEHLAAALPETAASVLALDSDLKALERWSAEPVASALVPAHTAYVLFTSGSTGRPKGVMIPHAAICHHMLWMQASHPIGADDCVLQKTPISFDASVWEFYAPLLVGGRLAVAPAGEHRDPARLVERLRAERVTVLQVVPTLLQLLLQEPGFVECADLRRVYCGGEPLTEDLMESFLTRLPAVELINVYGPTEATIHASSQLFVRETPLPVSIGRPIHNARVQVVDAAFAPAPLGVPGELLVAGAGLARGYLGRPDLTAERFVPDPSGEPGGRTYRTGDRVRWQRDGRLEFLGRIDHQVKVRGFRIELGEIEAVLRTLPMVREAVVLAREDAPGDRRLVAYVAGEGDGVSAPALREALRPVLPEYMVPAAFVVLDRLPLTPNGKVDRKALPAPEAPAEEAGAYLAPRSPTEEIVAAVFSDVMGLERVGALGHFFELGGHSLLATRVISRLRGAFRVELPLRALFEAPTVEAQAARVEHEMRTGAGLVAPPIVPVPRDRELPLSFAQQRLWFIDQLEPGSPLYNIPLAFRVEGPLDAGLLARSLQEVVHRHEALRTVFAAVDGVPVQVILPAEPFALPLLDLRALDAGRREAVAQALIAQESGRPFDLAHGPLFRAVLLRLGERDHAVVVAMHHIVSDGWSVGVLMREVTELYRAFAEGRPSPLPELPVQYADFAAWQRDWLAGEVLERQLSYWKGKLAGAPPALDLPIDRPRPAVQTFRGATRELRLSRELTAGVEALGRKNGATPFMVLLAAFQAVLSRWSGQSDVSVGSPIAGRNRLEIEGLIGFFVNTLVLRTELADALAFTDLLEQVRESSLEAHTHQDVPFEKLVEELEPERSLSHSPLFQVLFILQNTPQGGSAEVSDLVLRPWASGSGLAKFDLTLAFQETDGRLEGGLEHNTDLFDATTAERLGSHLVRLLEAALVDPAGRVSELPLLAEAEQAQVLAEWSDTGDPAVPASCLHELFAAQARRTPDATALFGQGRRLSYRQLDRRSNGLAHHLRSLGVGPESVVGVCLERTPDLVVALLGVLKAGGAYLPLDPEYPRERLALMLEDAGAAVVVSQKPLVERIAGLGTTSVLLLEEAAMAPARQAPEVAVTAGNLAYLIYTSGSTGRPKGVAITHGSAAALVGWAAETFAAEELAGVLAATSLSFDLSVFELFVPLCLGGAVIVARNALELGEHPQRKRVRLVNTVPSALAELVRAGALPAGVRTVNLAGEPLPRELADRILELGTVERLWNLYGPSEDTTYSTAARIGRETRPPAIGRPVPGTRARVLDPSDRPAPIGVSGELFLAGAGLARGYLGRPELTAERFVPDPFGAPGGRMYRTGDRVRWRADGQLDFLGRLDHQVKVRGFRIELGEVEATLRALTGVRDAVVLAREDAPGERRLVAYVTPAGEPLSVARLRESLGHRLPDHMVPAAFVMLETLPLTPNGKVDRKALPAPEAPAEVMGAYLAPRTPTEEIVAAVFSDVLGLERVGALGHFFELGGHSLLATRVISRLRGAFRVELPLRALFEAPTVEALAARVEHEMRAGSNLVAPPIVPVPRDRDLPLSFAQQRLWFIDQLEPGSSLYNMPLAFRVEGPLDAGLLTRSLQEVVRRHEALRTVFAAVDGVPVQVILPAEPFALPLLDLRELDAERREAVAQMLIAGEAGRPFDLARGPLFRAVLLRLGDRDHAVVVAMHHIVSDGWSVGVLMREVTELYRAFAEGRPSPLPELPVQYADFAAWQRDWLAGEVLERQLSYWKGKLAGAPPALDLPTDRPRPTVQTFRGATRELRLSRELTAGVEALGRKNGATPFMVLLAAFQAVLSRWSGQSDVSVGSPIAGRNRLEIEGLIGFFVNTLVLRTEVADAPAFTDLLERVRESSLEAHTHQDVPFEKLVEELEPERSLSHSPLFQVLFILQNTPQGETAEVSDLVLRPWASGSGVAKFDLTLSFQETDGRLEGGLEHNIDLFDATTAERWGSHLVRLLEAALVDPAGRVSELPLLGEAEQAQVLLEWSDTGDAAVSAGCLHELFAAQARRTPNATALFGRDRRLSYRQLDRRSNGLAHHLRSLGVGLESVVGVCLERTPDLMVALLGVLKAGGAYLPLDPEYPRERLALMLQDAGAAAVVSQETLAERIAGLGTSSVLILDETAMAPARQAPEVAVTAGNLAYLIYTSGSTGRPKGVAITHGSAAALVDWAAGTFAAEELSGVLAATSLSFDLSVFELFVPLCLGGTVIVARNALELGEHPQRKRVRLVNTVPSALSELVRAGRLPAGLRTVNLAGEPLPRELADRILELGTVERLWNLYGPSEDTTYSTAARIGRDGRRPAIGRPVPDTRARVLDPSDRPAPIGVSGELFLAGAGLARGYLGRPELTAERFLPDPFGAPGGRMYRTGDRVRWRADGQLDFLGRLDHQVKVRGFRIELGEVEATLRALAGVRDAAVLARKDAPGERRLVAYVTPAGEPLSVARLRESLGQRLPDHMVPAAFVMLETLPLTPNGKVDRKALPAPEAAARQETLYLAPRDAMELQLVRIWEELLDVRPIGVLDDFFSLGGHSLMALRLMARLRDRLGRDLPLAALFRTPSVAGLARLLRSAGPPERREPLVEIQPGRGLAPLFLVHPVGGEVLCYVDLARGLGAERPVYGLQVPDPEPGQEPMARVEEMAASYLASVRRAQPTGPYLLAGWSMGGLVAFEMARQLRSQGDEVARLVLIDSHLVRERESSLGLAQRVALFARDLFGILGSDLPPVDDEVWALEGEELLRVLYERARAAEILPPDLAFAELRSSFDVFSANLDAMDHYSGSPYPGAVALVAAEERSAGVDAPEIAWAGLAAELDLFRLPGDHYSILRQPLVMQLAGIVRAYLAPACPSE